LNYLEGFVRQRKLVNRNFIEISYGSLQESNYLIEFSTVEGWLDKKEADKLRLLAQEIGAMLWGILKRSKSDDA